LASLAHKCPWRNSEKRVSQPLWKQRLGGQFPDKSERKKKKMAEFVWMGKHFAKQKPAFPSQIPATVAGVAHRGRFHGLLQHDAETRKRRGKTA